ncbi:MAG: hypothetical protein M1827_004314 [Pycnora praestabilis]|nr:MAG: hypothetical protein M1827_004314 [Pycnora praestabilis]
MQIASIIADLTSLNVCDYDSALALLNASKDLPSKLTTPTTSSSSPPSYSPPQRPSQSRQISDQANSDPDLKRAKDIMELHYGVKVRYEGGLGEEMREARRRVNGILRELLEKRGEKKVEDEEKATSGGSN